VNDRGRPQPAAAMGSANIRVRVECRDDLTLTL